jgi:hypothetical protein
VEGRTNEDCGDREDSTLSDGEEEFHDAQEEHESNRHERKD